MSTDAARTRARLRRDVRVITTAPRVSGYVVALLPLLTVVAMYFTSRYYIDTLLSRADRSTGRGGRRGAGAWSACI